MKKSLIFFFFLLLFSRCENIGDTSLALAPVAGERESSTPGTSGSIKSAIITAGPTKKVTGQEKKRQKKRISANKKHPRTVPASSGIAFDSLFISRLKYLRSNGIEPDLNEPVSKDYLFSPVANRKFASLITLSRESLITVNFDNDILDYTDRFYTNGFRIEIISPGMQMNPLSRLMLPYWGSGTNYYGLSLVQNMFTPSTTKTGGILYGDRPYAAYLYAGTFKITNDKARRFRQTSELDAGIIGPNSYGEWVQRSFHNAVPTNNEPLGWEFQIKNDLILNYMVSFEKGVLSQKNFEFLLALTGNVGTLYSNLAGGGQIRAGWFNPHFANLGIAKKQILNDAGLRKTQFFFFIKGSGKLVGYDATLQGGMFNRSSVYKLPAGEISRLVFQSSGGITFSRNGIRLDVEQFMLSPEFQNGWWHKWVHVALTFSL
ncbi:MAG: lipid A deacylase LpxR family protein [Bacteroidales bacterium]|nr:lipid A deacylase LpxR family protein [Bacteroidales bacterium]